MRDILRRKVASFDPVATLMDPQLKQLTGVTK